MSTPSSPPRRALVIGAGLGGLAAAVRLQARGIRTTVLELNDQPGGRASCWTLDGYRFDAGPTIITAPWLIDELFSLGGSKTSDYLTLHPCDPYYRVIFHDGSHLDYRGGAEELGREVRRLSPSDERGFEKFARFSETVFRRGFVDLADKPFLRLWDMARVAPAMIRLQAYRSVYDIAAGYVKDPRLRFLFSFHPLFVGGSPFQTPALYAMVHHLEMKWGVHYVSGGTGELVRGLANHLARLGGIIRTRAGVRKILVENGRAMGVELEDGSRMLADHVVSNADVATTYGRLIAPRWRKRWTDRKLARADYSMGIFIVHFGLNRPLHEFPHHTILLGPRYRGHIEDIFRRKILADDFSLYLYNPSRVDPTMAPPGHSACYVLSPVPNLAAHIDWEALKEKYADRILASLERHAPGLRRHITCRKVMTPVDFEKRYQAVLGNAFSLCPTLMQSAWFRPHNASEDIQELYLVGAGTHPGAGVPGVLCSAKALDALIP